ncbi:hypothetical protein CHISP_3484 [Chitinispirillum alkaliphilum]|nr:hypothetical protein CHISP_3484 [Chitinispirillum alkaliphilum]
MINISIHTKRGITIEKDLLSKEHCPKVMLSQHDQFVGSYAEPEYAYRNIS